MTCTLGLRSTASQRKELQRLQLNPQQRSDSLVLKGQATRLEDPEPGDTLAPGAGWREGESLPHRPRPSPPLSNPAIARWLRRRSGARGAAPSPSASNRCGCFRSGGQLQRIGLTLKPLTMAGQQQGLRFLPQLSQPLDAVVAINGGFFNRILQLPLGALRQQGEWLSGPILNRGVIAWSDNDPLQFGRLRLDQQLQVNGGRRWRLSFLNSGYVQRGLSRYTRAWGPIYRPLSGEEEALLIARGSRHQRFDRTSIRRGVLIPSNGDLVVARGRTPCRPNPATR